MASLVTACIIWAVLQKTLTEKPLKDVGLRRYPLGRLDMVSISEPMAPHCTRIQDLRMQMVLLWALPERIYEGVKDADAALSSMLSVHLLTIMRRFCRNIRTWKRSCYGSPLTRVVLPPQVKVRVAVMMA
ncbi:hypothetical protein GOP47_0021419 [Adiantum capillus-veneris]|uniref:Uncharacterized protein n=1 Tax=Adiantum capillus-veneris TaxID=13818 RepID=A0A9D4Z6X9_ADICA|nr:hypothetical protein GOP47_0021419 [Adiantum capillus-veneris]